MLEISYDTETKEIRAWNADMSVQGNLQPEAGQTVVIWDIDLPPFESDIYWVVLATQTVKGNPDYIAEKLQREVDMARVKEISGMGHSNIPPPLLPEMVCLMYKLSG